MYKAFNFMPKTWFAYTGNNVPSNFYVRTNYYSVTPTFPAGTGNGSRINLILANGPDGNMHPTTISLNLQWYIDAGLSSNYAQPQSPYGIKKYVYLIDP